MISHTLLNLGLELVGLLGPGAERQSDRGMFIRRLRIAGLEQRSCQAQVCRYAGWMMSDTRLNRFNDSRPLVSNRKPIGEQREPFLVQRLIDRGQSTDQQSSRIMGLRLRQATCDLFFDRRVGRGNKG